VTWAGDRQRHLDDPRQLAAGARADLMGLPGAMRFDLGLLTQRLACRPDADGQLFKPGFPQRSYSRGAQGLSAHEFQGKSLASSLPESRARHHTVMLVLTGRQPIGFRLHSTGQTLISKRGSVKGCQL
jgi:hypothetical protein